MAFDLIDQTALTRALTADDVLWGATASDATSPSTFSRDAILAWLGTATFADLFLESGGVVNFNSGDVTITHSLNTLTFAGATSGYVFDNALVPATSGGANLGTTSLPWGAAEFADSGTVAWATGETISGVAGVLTFSGATAYDFDAPIKLGTATTLNWGSGDIVATYSTSALTFTGDSAFTFRLTDALFRVTNAGTAFRIASEQNTTTANVGLFEGVRSGTAASNDEAYNAHYLKVSSGSSTEIARLTWAAPTVTAGSEEGRWDFGVKKAGTMTDMVSIDSAGIYPPTNDLISLGKSGKAFADLFLASGAVVNFNAGADTLTHSSGALAFTGSITAMSATAAPAGGNASYAIKLGSGGRGIFYGSGAPTLSAGQGSLYIRSDGSSTSTRLYVNTNGTTGWTNVTTAT